MARLLITMAMGATLAATGCSSTQRARVDYPPAQLVHDAPAIQVAPTRDGHGATVGFNLAAVRQYGVWAVVKDNPWKSTLLTAATGYGGYWIYQNYIDDDDDRPPRPVGASGTFEISDKGATSGTFDDLTGSATIIVDKTEPTPEGPRETRVQIVIDQDDKD